MGFQLELLILVITMATQTYGADSVVTSTWERLLGNNVTVDAQVSLSRSSFDCAVACKNRPGCSYFCHDPTASRCYVSFVQTSAIMVTATNQVMCYRCGFSGCCPLSEGYILHNGNCIKLYTSGLNYTAAGDRCALDGGHLCHYKSVDLSPEYTSLLSTVPRGKVWLGADANNANREFVWSDGSPLPIGSPLWGNNQPDNHAGRQYCASHCCNNLIDDFGCQAALPFICQIDV